MDIYKYIEETQKKMFNDSSIVQYGGSNYIYPYTSLHQEVVNNSLNRYYKGYIKKKLFNIYDNGNRVLDIIENMNNKKALELLKKEKEKNREKLLHDIYNEDVSKYDLGRQKNINVLNFEEKLKDKMFSSENGNNILYILMKFLLNRPKKERKIKIKRRLEELYSEAREKNYSKILNKLINKKDKNFQVSKINKKGQEIHIQKSNLPTFINNTFLKENKENNIELNNPKIKKSKSLSNLKSFSKKYFSEKNIINTKGNQNFIEKKSLNNYNELENQHLNENSSLNNSFNKEKLNNLSKENSQEKSEFLLFKKKLESNKIYSKDNLTINFPESQRSNLMEKINYINKKKLEKIRLKFVDKKNDLISNSLDKSNKSGLDLYKNKRSILLNFKKLHNKFDKFQQINQSFRSEKKMNLKKDIKDKNNKSLFLNKRNNLKKDISSKIIKEERENMEKYNPKHIIYSIKSNYSLLQTNRHFFGAKNGIDEIDIFRQNFSSEIRKQFIQKDKNLDKINMKKIIKKFSPHYKFVD